jgi:predicted DNA binding CopG/RHH family protein
VETDSIDELARFWDNHDLTDFEDELEEVPRRIFSRRKETTVAVALTPKEAQAVRRLADAQGINESKLLREWVREKLRGSSPRKPPNKVQTDGGARRLRQIET